MAFNYVRTYKTRAGYYLKIQVKPGEIQILCYTQLSNFTFRFSGNGASFAHEVSV